jgi:prolyl-tRNA synthetase
VELVRRDTMGKVYVKCDNLPSQVTDLLEDIQGNLFAQANAVLNKSISDAASFDELKSIIDNKGGLVFCGWCQNQECELRIKEATGADLRVIPFDNQDLSKFPNCIYCKKKAFCVAVFAQAY